MIYHPNEDDQGGLLNTFKSGNLLSDPQVLDSLLRAHVVTMIDYWEQVQRGGVEVPESNVADYVRQICDDVYADLIGNNSEYTVTPLQESLNGARPLTFTGISREYQVSGTDQQVCDCMMSKMLDDSVEAAVALATGKIDKQGYIFAINVAVERGVHAILAIPHCAD